MPIKEYRLDPTVRSKLNPVPRKAWHVCKADAGNVDYLYDNVPGGQLFHTINDAMANAGDYDEVIVWPGEWTESATINITQTGLRLRAYEVGGGAGLSAVELWQYAGTNTPVVTVAAKGVEICGFQFLPYDDVAGWAIAVGVSVESKYFYIHDNYFRAVGGSQCGYITAGTASTADAQMGMIENNYFRRGGSTTGNSAQILLGQATGTTIRNNNFLLAGNGTGFKSIDLGTAIVQRIIIQDNLFMAFEVGGVMFIEEGTGSTTDGHMYVDGNHFIGATADGNCFTYNADNAGVNYLNYGVIGD